jgi:GNAT superfamily N-acetyltransferase
MPNLRAASEADLPGILAIYNDVIATSTAVYTAEPAVEHSVHVRADVRGRGIGRLLVEALFPAALALSAASMRRTTPRSAFTRGSGSSASPASARSATSSGAGSTSSSCNGSSTRPVLPAREDTLQIFPSIC